MLEKPKIKMTKKKLNKNSENFTTGEWGKEVLKKLELKKEKS